MIHLYHCINARSLRPLWTLEEMRLPYELTVLPFPPRALAPEYKQLNPLGTIPLLLDGDTRTPIGDYAIGRFADPTRIDAAKLAAEFDPSLLGASRQRERA